VQQSAWVRTDKHGICTFHADYAEIGRPRPSMGTRTVRTIRISPSASPQSLTTTITHHPTLRPPPSPTITPLFNRHHDMPTTRALSSKTRSGRKRALSTIDNEAPKAKKQKKMKTSDKPAEKEEQKVKKGKGREQKPKRGKKTCVTSPICHVVVDNSVSRHKTAADRAAEDAAAEQPSHLTR